MIGWRLDCSRHRPALDRFVELRESGDTTPGALTHLDGCPRCRREIEESAALAIALRRIGSDPVAGPRPDGWLVLRSRIERGHEPRWRRRIDLAGAIAGVALAAAILLPTAWSSLRPSTLDEAGPLPAATADAVRRDAAAEAAWLRRNLAARKEAASDSPTVAIRPAQDVFGPEARIAPAAPSAAAGPLAQ